MAIENVRFVLAFLMVLEAVAQRCSLEKFLWKAWQNAMENAFCFDEVFCRESFKPDKTFHHRCFPANLSEKHTRITPSSWEFEK